MLKNLHPRKRAALIGATGGLAAMIGQAWLPEEAYSYYRFKKQFRNGVAWGIGIGGGIVCACNLLMFIADRAAPDDMETTDEVSSEVSSRNDTSEGVAKATPVTSISEMKSSQEVSEESKGIKDKGTKEKSEAEPQANDSDQEFSGAEGWRALVAGGMAVTLGSVAVATAFTLLPSLLSPGGKPGWLTRIDYSNRDYFVQFKRQSALGLSLGLGLMVGGTVLNWMIEEMDSIVGEKNSEDKNEQDQAKATERR
jgi:hypothetical protein